MIKRVIIIGLGAIGGVQIAKVVSRKMQQQMKHTMREHCKQMAAQCKQMATQFEGRSKVAART